MGILALKVAGKKNGVSKLHGAVSRELFGDVWPNIAANESPITHITNGIHTCSWLAPNLKQLYNKYLIPYWQDSIQIDETWKKIESIPNEKLWEEHMKRKVRLLELVKQNVTNNMRSNGKSYEEINDIVSKLNPNALTIGFARRFVGETCSNSTSYQIKKKEVHWIAPLFFLSYLTNFFQFVFFKNLNLASVNCDKFFSGKV